MCFPPEFEYIMTQYSLVKKWSNMVKVYGQVPSKGDRDTYGITIFYHP